MDIELNDDDDDDATVYDGYMDRCNHAISLE